MLLSSDASQRKDLFQSWNVPANASTRILVLDTVLIPQQENVCVQFAPSEIVRAFTLKLPIKCTKQIQWLRRMAGKPTYPCNAHHVIDLRQQSLAIIM